MNVAHEHRLPPGWVSAELSKIAQINPPLDLRIDDESAAVSFVPMRAVEPEGGGLLRPEVSVYGKVKKGYTAFRSGDVIMAKITPCMENGKTCVVPDLPGAACFGSTEFHVVRVERDIDARWVASFLLRQSTRHAAQRKMMGGVGQMRVPSAFLESLKIPVPPRAEQQRILGMLDEIFSDLDAGAVALKRARAKLKLYRASVLKAAVEGALTADWRAKHPDIESASVLLQRILIERRRRWEESQLETFRADERKPPSDWKSKYRQPAEVEAENLPTLPGGWCWASLDQLGRLDRGKSRHRPRDAAFLYGGPYPFIQTGDVRKSQQYLREHSQTYSDDGLRQSRLWPAETLCITIAANIAETAILAYPACFPDSIVGVVFEEELVSTRYVEFFMRHARERIASYAPATAQKNINNEILRKISVPLPPFHEQLALVETVEDQLSVVEHLEADIDAKLKSAHALRQSIVRDAFAGKLVPQDPNEEPAAMLLERIVAERNERLRLIASGREGRRKTEPAKTTMPKTPRKSTASKTRAKGTR